MPTILDASQRAVLDLPEDASATVLGVAGAGKTTTIVELVADRLARPGWAGGDVLVLAGSRAAATRLRDRLAARVDVVTPGPLARTAASFAYALLGEQALADGVERPQLLSGAEQDGMLADLLAGHVAMEAGPAWPQHLGPEVREQQGFRTELRDVLARAREQGLDRAALEALAREQDRPEWAAAGAIQHELDQVLALAHRDGVGAVDAASLLARAAAIVERGGRRLRLLVVDDAQELTEGAARLVAALHATGTAVVAFGDPDTATDMFRGADPSIVGGLGARLGFVTRIDLAIDHRHGPALRAAIGDLSARIGTALGGTHRAAEAAGGEGAIAVHRVDGAVEQARRVARILRRRHLVDGVAWGEMAVVTRSGRLAAELERALADLEVPTLREGGSAVRASSVADDLVAMLAVVTGVEPIGPESSRRILSSPLVGLDGVGLRRLRRAVRHRAIAAERPPGSGDELLAEALADETALDGVGGPEARIARDVASRLRHAATRAQGDDPDTAVELLWRLWDGAGVADAWRDAALAGGADAAWAHRRLDAVVALLDHAARHAERHPDVRADEFVRSWRSAALELDSLAGRQVADSVRIGTPSQLVSVELDTVVVAGVQEGAWPNLRPRGSLLGAQLLGAHAVGGVTTVTDVADDELRMLVHAIARARAAVHVVAIDTEEERPARWLALLPDAPEESDARGRTLRELVGTLRRLLVDEQTSTGVRAEAATALARLAAEGVPGAAPEQWAGLAAATSDAPLVDEGEPVRVSPSALEGFEACPVDWAVGRLAPTGSATPQAIGTIVHAAVEHADAADPAALLAAVEERWAELAFRSPWESARERAIVEQIVGAIADYVRTERALGWRIDVGDHERRFELQIGDVVLSGSIDWIERRGGEVRIVDLKTGRAKPSGPAIAEHAQLRAYQLAAARGAIASVPAGTTSAGARLLYPRDPKPIGDQEALAPDELGAFEERVVDVAARMAAATFTALPLEHCLNEFAHGQCEIHVRRQVTQ
ncbi:UrvD/REP family ATP-dependent DNA helicase [Agrococcus sp. SGAir0287]|uniref:UrvD/REP family ATP-dependent DNA helicase n=1 Tax=Agrococcus sp. SGAir0287 TaxID=2070347 RepID=UPI001586735B|nr:UrvD/REP family ATP-dependent DNA helicase [Agrococcus sp. SGAir0287]